MDRQEMINRLLKADVETIEEGNQHLIDILSSGFVGYNNHTDEQLQEEIDNLNEREAIVMGGYTYYRQQLNKVGSSEITFKFKSDKGESKWLNLNKSSLVELNIWLGKQELKER